MKEIVISKNQAGALQSDISEINQLKQQLEGIIQIKIAALNRHADTIIKDAGEDPGEVLWDLKEEDGVHTMALAPRPKKLVGMTPQQQEESKKEALSGGGA